MSPRPTNIPGAVGVSIAQEALKAVGRHARIAGLAEALSIVEGLRKPSRDLRTSIPPEVEMGLRMASEAIQARLDDLRPQ